MTSEINDPRKPRKRPLAPSGILALTAALWLLGCPTRQEVTFENETPMCVASYGLSTIDIEHGELTEMPFAADLPLTATVLFDYCLSSSCDTDRATNCAIRLQNDAPIIDVSSHGSYVHHSGGACTDDCGYLGATCDTGPIPAGEYTIRYAGQEKTLTIPSTGMPVCFD